MHLDVKPSNIFLTRRQGEDDFVKLLDFGTSRLVASAEPEDALDDPDRSGRGAVAIPHGTVIYMAPEQAAGRAVDHRSDVYALGAVLYEMLSGSPPFTARTLPEYVHKHMHVRPEALAQRKDLPNAVSPHASRLVARCLEKNPEDRPQSAGALRDRLADVAATTWDLSLAAGRPPRAAKRGWFRGATGWVAGLLALGLAAGVTVFVFGGGGAPAQRATRFAATVIAADPVPAPPQVAFQVVTVPAGAVVVRMGPVQRILGVTPLTIRLPRTGDPMTVRIALSGYRAETRSVDVSQGAPRLKLTLEKVLGASPKTKAKTQQAMKATVKPVMRPRPVTRPPARPSARPPRGMTPGDSGGTINPFEMR